MRNKLFILACSLLYWLAPAASYAQTIELQAVEDFINLDSGEVPYYLDLAGSRNALAINAAREEYRGKFARAEYEFLGSDGLYDITIKALGEIDGDCEYRLLVNGVEIGAAINPPVAEDYQVIEHTFVGVSLNFASTIAVESNAVSNGIIPEGDGFAFARGRWRSLVIAPSSDDSVSQNNTVDLGLTINAVGDELTQGQTTTFFINAINLSADNAATNAVVEIDLPESIEFAASANCIQSASGALCFLPELSASQSQTVSFMGRLANSGDFDIAVLVTADQTDTDNDNNNATITISVSEEMPVQSNDTETDTDQMDNSTNNNSAAEADANGGAIGFLLFALMTTCYRRYRSIYC